MKEKEHGRDLHVKGMKTESLQVEVRSGAKICADVRCAFNAKNLLNLNRIREELDGSPFLDPGERSEKVVDGF